MYVELCSDLSVKSTDWSQRILVVSGSGSCSRCSSLSVLLALITH